MIESIKRKQNVLNINLVNFKKQIIYNRMFQIDFDDVCLFPKHSKSELGLDIYSWLCFNYAYGIMGYIFKDEFIEPKDALLDKRGNKYKIYLFNTPEMMDNAKKALKMKLQPILVKENGKTKVILE